MQLRSPEIVGIAFTKKEKKKIGSYSTTLPMEEVYNLGRVENALKPINLKKSESQISHSSLPNS